MTYISLFSGIGGLEHPSVPPSLLCEMDNDCRTILSTSYPSAVLHPDVETLAPPQCDVVCGGWPCQDISIAGAQLGLGGSRSKLFYSLLRIAVEASAETIVAENVPNLLRIAKGEEFLNVLRAFQDAGYPFISWRILNAREFGLPQERRRLLIVASKSRETAMKLHRPIPSVSAATHSKPVAAGFYWTGGARSICYSKGYIPAVKVGASDNNGRGNIALHYGNRIRKLSAAECIRLQGFESGRFQGISQSKVFQMAGNAVAQPVGQFAVQTALDELPVPEIFITGFDGIAEAGLMEGHHTWEVSHQSVRLATNLDDYVDLSDPGSLSSQAAAGILVRTVRARGMLPIDLFDLLCDLASLRVGPVVGSRSNSFEVLDREIDLKEYRTVLTRELKEQTYADDGQMSLDLDSEGTVDVLKEGAF
jgi:DNA (cytosine-5)-methyltransferase 1